MGYLAAITAAVQAAGFAASGIKHLIDNSDDIVKSLNSLATMLDAAKRLMDTAVDVVPINELINQAEMGETAQLEPVLSPEKFRKEPVSFETSDSEVAAVTDEGLIVAITPGTATVKLSAGGCNKEVKVTVESKPVPVYYDTDGGASGTYGVSAIPTTYFVNAKGELIARGVGALDGASLKQGIEMIIP